MKLVSHLRLTIQELEYTYKIIQDNPQVMMPNIGTVGKLATRYQPYKYWLPNVEHLKALGTISY